jgi:N-acetylneuraminic acid mutarotase
MKISCKICTFPLVRSLFVLIMLLLVSEFCLALEDKWEKKADMPTPRVGCSSSVVNEKIYVIGGISPAEYSTKTEEYDPNLDKWAAKADMPTPRCCLTTTTVNGKIYAIGGYNQNAVLSSVEVYDPKSDTWERKTPIPSSKWLHPAVAINDKIYVFGGDGDGWIGNLSFYIYDTIIDQWEQVDDVPQPYHMENPSTISVEDKIYCFGGFNGFNFVMQRNVIVYDTKTKKWGTKSEVPTPREGMAVGMVSGNMYLISGYSPFQNFVGLAKVEVYNIDTDKWEKESRPDMPTSRCFFASSQIGNNIYVLGGATNWPDPWPNSFLSTNEVYTVGNQYSVNPQDKITSTWGSIKSIR